MKNLIALTAITLLLSGCFACKRPRRLGGPLVGPPIGPRGPRGPCRPGGPRPGILEDNFGNIVGAPVQGVIGGNLGPASVVPGGIVGAPASNSVAIVDPSVGASSAIAPGIASAPGIVSAPGVTQLVPTAAQQGQRREIVPMPASEDLEIHAALAKQLSAAQAHD